MVDSLTLEIEAIGLSNLQLETRNALLDAGLSATDLSTEGIEIRRLVLERERDEITAGVEVINEQARVIREITEVQRFENDVRARAIALIEAEARAREDGRVLTDVEREAVVALTNANLALSETQAMILSEEQGIANVANQVAGALTNVITGTESASDAMRSFALAIAEAILQAIILKAVTAAFPGGGGGGGGIGSIFALFAAGGGMIRGGKPVPLQKFDRGGIARGPTLALFGEKEDEAFVPVPNGRIPVEFVKESPGVSGGRSSGEVTVSPQFNIKVDMRFEGKQEKGAVDGAGLKTAKKLGQVVDVVLRDWALEQQRPGGLFNRGMQL